jgi:hypothetical protein
VDEGKFISTLDAQTVDTIKVATVISQQSEVVLECGGGDHEIHVANTLASWARSWLEPDASGAVSDGLGEMESKQIFGWVREVTGRI